MDPALLMFPATLSNSLAFMMPVGTPPNAIVYGTGRVRIIDMVRYGFVLNLIGVVIVTLVCWQLLPLVFGVHRLSCDRPWLRVRPCRSSGRLRYDDWSYRKQGCEP